jgi:hypothetical protein
MILSNSVEDTISKISEAPGNKSFIHFNIPTIPKIPVSEPLSVSSHLPDDVNMTEVWKRLGIDHATHSLLLVWVCPSVQQSSTNINGRETQREQETMISDLYKRSDAVSRTTLLPSTWFQISNATKHSKVLEMVKMPPHKPKVTMSSADTVKMAKKETRLATGTSAVVFITYQESEGVRRKRVFLTHKSIHCLAYICNWTFSRSFPTSIFEASCDATIRRIMSNMGFLNSLDGHQAIHFTSQHEYVN